MAQRHEIHLRHFQTKILHFLFNFTVAVNAIQITIIVLFKRL